MWIQIRTFDGSRTVKVDSLSKLTKVEELRDRLVELFDVEPERQWLFYRGKQMVNGHTLYDYDVRQNDLIQIMIRPAKNQDEEDDNDEQKENEEPNSGDESHEEDVDGKDNEEAKKKTNELNEETSTEASNLQSEEKMDDMPASSTSSSDSEEMIDTDCPEDATYKSGDYVDVRDPTLGCWFEGLVLKVSENQPKTDKNANVSMFKEGNSYYYEVKYESENSEDDERLTVTLESVRPRSVKLIPFTEVVIKQQVLVNFNLDDRKKRGYWYDAIVQRKQTRRTQKDLFCTVMMGKDLAPLEDCQIQFVNEIFQIEEPGEQINMKDIKAGEAEKPKLRKNKAECDACQDNPNIVCKMCWCNVCGGKDRPEMQIMCDECDLAYHINCLNPPLEKIPEEDEWYCPACKNSSDIVKAGEKLKENKKKAKMISATGKTSRDWGKGMACVGRTKICTLVPTNHFGSIPGVEVGSLWKYRVQVSEAGVHRPHVAGISGRESEGAFSIVLSGGYEDDHDDGDEFLYTGSGGRDLSGNKRTAEQSCDQVLTRMNMALVKNCNAKINAKDGAESTDWKKGRPVRVVRNSKAAKHSEYAPEEGNRYDGLYKLVKYWPEKGKSGFIVWRYRFRRDDPTPAPWTKEGKKRIKELGLTMVYPDGYLDKNEDSNEEKKGKRKSASNGQSPSKKKQKKSPTKKYEIDEEVAKLIEEDALNDKVWQRAKEVAGEDGKQKFLDYVQEEFMCICCQEVVCKPVTTKCLHNICKQCLQRSFKAEVYSCPSCRAELGEKSEMKMNETLNEALLALFPGYQAGRG